MAIELLSNLLQKNRAANVSSTAFFYLMDTSNIDYRVKGIQEDNSLVPVLDNGNKYILRNINSLNVGFTGIGGPIQGLQNNDIVMYQNGGFILYVDVTNPETNRGEIVYNDSDDKLYYFNGTIWKSLGLGSLYGTPNQISISGSTGDTYVGLTPVVIIENYILTPELRFLNGISMGGTGDSIQVYGNINIKGNILADGEIITKSAFRGFTSDSDIEQLTDIAVDAGDY